MSHTLVFRSLAERGRSVLIALLLAGTFFAGRALAQDTTPPWIDLVTPANLTGNFSPAAFEIHWCDDVAVSTNPSLHSVLLNGVEERSSLTFTFTGADPAAHCGSSAYDERVSTGTLTLNPGPNTLVLSVYDAALNQTQTGTITIVRPPVIAATPSFALNKVQDYGRCALACYTELYAISTVPYFTLDRPRSLTLTYNGGRVDPKPFVHVDLTPTGADNKKYQLQVKKTDGTSVSFVNGESTLTFCMNIGGQCSHGSSPIRIGGQLDVSTWPTGAYDVYVIVSVEFTNGVVKADTLNETLSVVNWNASSVARGWNVAGVARIYTQGAWPTPTGALVVEGDGSASFYRKSGSVYLQPAGEFDSLIYSSSDSTWYRWSPDSTRSDFNKLGYLLAVSRAGEAHSKTQFVYESYGAGYRVRRVISPWVDTITVHYGTYGMDSITDARGRVTKIVVGSDSSLTAFTDPDAVGTSFIYGSRRLAVIKDRRGKPDSLEYDAQSGLLTRKAGPSFTAYSGSVAPATRMVSHWKRGVPYAATSGTAFDPPLISGAGSDSLLVDSLFDPGGHRTLMRGHNTFGQPARVDMPYGRSMRMTYWNGLVETAYDAADVLDPVGLADSVSHNAKGLPTRIKPKGRPVVNYAYTSGWGVPDSIWGTGMPTVRRTIGAHGFTEVQAVAGVAVDTTTHDDYGRLIQARDSMGHLLIKHVFDATTGNRVSDSIPGNRMTAYKVDKYGRDSLTKARLRDTIVTVYDVLNRPLKTLLTRGTRSDSVLYTYGDSLHLTKIRDAKGQWYTFSYGPGGLLESTSDSAGRTLQYKYDVEGQLVALINRRGDTLRFTYDSLHRETSKWGKRGGTATDSTYLRYGNNGRTVGSISPMVQESLFVNYRGQIDSTYTWHNSGSWRYPMFYHYDPAARLDTLWASGVSSAWKKRGFGYHATRATLDTLGLDTGKTYFTRNGDLNVDYTTYPAGYADWRNLTSFHALTQISAFWNDTTISNAYYQDVRKEIAYDSAANLANDFDWWGNGIAYHYDKMGRLDTAKYYFYNCYYTDLPDGYPCGALGTIDSTHAFAYDAAHNRTDHSATYAVGNRITHFGSCNYNTDADGNVINRVCTSPAEKDTLFWSVDSRLDSIHIVKNTADTTRLRFWYDRVGRLMRMHMNDSVRYFLWNGDELYGEMYGPTGEYAGQYSYYGTDNLHAFINPGGSPYGTPYFAHTDGLGNTYALTDNQLGGADRKYQYDEWGRLVGGADNVGFGDRDRVRWKGALFMAPQVGFGGFYYMRNRWYEPYTGRFLSEDPIGLGGGVNQYAFAGNNPVNGSDPSGRLSTLYECIQNPYCDWGADAGILIHGGDLGSFEIGFGGSGWGQPPTSSDPYVMVTAAMFMWYYGYSGRISSGDDPDCTRVRTDNVHCQGHAIDFKIDQFDNLSDYCSGAHVLEGFVGLLTSSTDDLLGGMHTGVGWEFDDGHADAYHLHLDRRGGSSNTHWGPHRSRAVADDWDCSSVVM